MADPHDATAHTLTTHTHTHAATTGQGAGDHHAQAHGSADHTDPEASYYRLKSGLYYPLTIVSTNSTPVLDELRVAWFPVGNTVTVDRIGIWVNAGVALSVVRLGIYRDTGSGYPGTLVLDAGTIDASSQGFKEITVSQQLTPDLYWVGGVGQTLVTAMTISCGPAASTFGVMGYTATPTGSTTGGAGFFQTGVSGALPGTFTSTVTTGTAIPRVHLRIA